MHVPALVAEEACKIARTSEANGVIAIGGGSTIGLAKIVALRTELPIVAVPTTYAGSEMTSIFGITEGGVKKTRSEEHTSELQSLMRISYAVFCLKKKTKIEKQKTDL